MKRRTFALGLFSSLFTLPSLGLAKSEYKSFQDVRKEVEEYKQLLNDMVDQYQQYQAAQLESELSEGKYWADINPLLPTNYLEWFAQTARYYRALSYREKQAGLYWTDNFMTSFLDDYFDGYIGFYPNEIWKLKKWTHDEQVMLLGLGAFVMLHPLSNTVNFKKSDDPLIDWVFNKDLFEMWAYQKQASKIMTTENLAKNYCPSNAKYSAIIDAPFLVRSPETRFKEMYKDYVARLERDPMAQAKGKKPLPYYEWTNVDPKADTVMYVLNRDDMSFYSEEVAKVGKQTVNEMKEAVIRYATFQDEKLKLPKKLLDRINS